MQENVGDVDAAIRWVLGPALVVLGYTRWGGRRGRPPGLAAMMAGVSVTESALTRTCPINAALGVDTRRQR